jgi:NAD(P)-dependent dehydrogenase (short-subunit alcohol dehydrogenase family)
VTVSSNAHALGRIDFADLQGEGLLFLFRRAAYNQSKLVNVMSTYELARRLRGSGVNATALPRAWSAPNLEPRIPTASSGSWFPSRSRS